jgi:NAD(P)-dependent dehydrogenase (short-subunit alcohol dehydrogenase family)
LSKEGVIAEDFPADAGDPQALRGALEEIIATVGCPSVLIYNAFSPVSVGSSDLYAGKATEVIDAFEESVVGPLIAIRTVVPVMRENGGGTVLVATYRPARLPNPRYTAESLARPALRTLINVVIRDSRTSPARVILADLPPRVPAGTWDEARTHSWLAAKYWSLAHAKSEGSRIVTIS